MIIGKKGQFGLMNNTEEWIEWRRHLHANPEFGFEENGTAAFVAKMLRQFGIDEITEGIGKTGVVATLRRGTSNKAIGLRADMDALKIQEAAERDHKSTRPGLMHACGHDGHTTMLLAAAQVLAAEGGFDGVVHFIFQPAEEWGKGMQAMLDDGLLDRFPFEEAYGIHNMPGLPLGHFATCSGAFMAAEDNFEIEISGQGGHAARPHHTNDAIVAACSTVLNLQTVVSRTIDPSELSVVSVTELLTDGTRNALAGSARILGDCRSFDPKVSQDIECALRRIAEGVCLANGCKAEVTYTREFVPLINDEDLTVAAEAAAQKVAKSHDRVDGNSARIGASEDFARLLEHVPGNFMNIGNGDSAPLHSRTYDFNDGALAYGANYFSQVVRGRLSD